MGIFGLGGDNGAGEYRRAAGSAADRLRGDGRRFSRLGSVAETEADGYRPQVSHILSLLSGQVERDNTDTGRSAFVNRQTADVTGSYNAAKANLTADLAERGISDSSSAAGGLATLEGARAGTFAKAENDANQYFDDRRYSRTQDLMSLLQQLYGGAQTRASNALGASAGINQGLFGGYSNLYQDAERKNAEETGQLLSLFGSIGQGVGWGAGRKG